ncbi:antibiotic biosynthesis monooxygenase [Streptomyces ruber]|uniref:Antibiotic biosynthesis monooxygenase n=2 Tax=Streptomyces TaxID=1883 RepID=A0A918BA96_9ACTN|nr:putative quinol monooxygenase [Streptomyces ruber]GGQ52015.1 antibiotic biosynthesis monooxygenase [Streptomyces ruber]
MTDTVSEPPVVLIARLRARTGREGELKDALAPLVRASRREDGCITYTPHQGQDDPALFVVHEVWRSEAHLRVHSESSHFGEFVRTSESLLDGGIAVEPFRVLDV